MCFGCSKEIELTVKENCKTCNGSGAKEGTSPETCADCRGTGTVRITRQTAFGAFAQVSYSTPQAMKNVLGYNAYILEGALNLTSIKPHHIKVEYDGNVIEGDYLYGMVSNTTSVGGVKNFPPGNPDLSDGLLEVTLISPIRGIKTVEEFGRAVLSGDPSVLSSVLTSFSTPKVTITSEAGLTWTLDGEPGGTHQVAEIEALHNAYTIVHGER